MYQEKKKNNNLQSLLKLVLFNENFLMVIQSLLLQNDRHQKQIKNIVKRIKKDKSLILLSVILLNL